MTKRSDDDPPIGPPTSARIVAHLAGISGLRKQEVRTILNELAGMAVSETRKHGAFIVPGIGKLVRVERKARSGRNPATGATIKIPAKKVVKFRVAKTIKDAVVPPKKK